MVRKSTAYLSLEGRTGVVRKIISGGQTGADRGGLIAGKILDIETGGTAPKGWMTETGPCPALGHFYGLTEGLPGYSARTRLNVINSGGTLIMGDVNSSGSSLTRQICMREGKPAILNPTPEEFRKWLENYKIEILNVAGNRESKNPGICTKTYELLYSALHQNS